MCVGFEGGGRRLTDEVVVDGKVSGGRSDPPHSTAGERPPRSPGCVEAPNTPGGLGRFDEGAAKRCFRPAQCEP